MAWYRAGGGGIPAALKTGMNDVLNKKFGTSTTYAPNTWPDNVNLLGKLPEKTVSGAIANIKDGADRVPVKNWQVTVGASLTGYSSVDVVHSGKNLANIQSVESCSDTSGAGSSITQNNNGTITVTTGTQANVKSLQKLRDIAPFLIIGQTYKLSAISTGTTKYIYMHQASQTWTFDGNKTITQEMLDSDISFYASGANGTTAVISDFQIELGTTATAYEAYTAPTNSTVSLGRTIYGGSVDVVNGEGVEECVKVKFSDLTWYTNLLKGAQQFYAVLSDSKTPINNNTILDGLLCNGYNVTYANDVYLDTSVGDKISVNTGKSVQVRDYSVTTLEAFIAKTANYELVYPLATPTDFTFTPITPTPQTALGVNNFWVDEGDSSVTYRRDIDLALGGG